MTRPRATRWPVAPDPLPEVEALAAAVQELVALNAPPWCTHDPEAWFADSAAERDRAAAMCARCPIRQTCHDAAEAAGEVHGVWGGIDRTKTTTRRTA